MYKVPPADESDELYVGYLPAPKIYRRFVRIASPALAIAFAFGAIAWGISYFSPGKGIWDTSQVREFTGIIHARPYAMIRVLEVDESPHTILLVQEGKRGAVEIGTAFDGKAARVRGFVLERDGHRLLELTSPPEPISPQKLAASEDPLFPDAGNGFDAMESAHRCEPAGSVTLIGEIIDPKCFFGAMKPGQGKVHKECATLCIAGGIPPMFLVRRANHAPEYYLLADPNGSALGQFILPYIADPVEISGQVDRCGDLRILKLNPASIHRL